MNTPHFVPLRDCGFTPDFIIHKSYRNFVSIALSRIFTCVNDRLVGELKNDAAHGVHGLRLLVVHGEKRSVKFL